MDAVLQCYKNLRQPVCRFLQSVWQLISVRFHATSGAAKNICLDDLRAQAEWALDEYGNSILRLAYSYLHNMSDAEDILQETLLQMLKTAPVFENTAHEKAWLMRVAANKSKNRIAYNKVRTTDELSEALAAKEQEDLSFVWEAVRALPVKYREVVHLFYEEDCSVVQIAQYLGMKESTVRSHLHRGRKMLKEILKEDYDYA